jgi:maleylpyruvate isomerase
MPAEAWQRVVRWTAGQERPAARIADSRLCEVLVHHVDLRAGVTSDHWPADFVADQLNKVATAFATRKNPPTMRIHATDTGVWHQTSANHDAVVIHGCQASLLAWLMGRSAGDDLITDSGMILPAPPFLY